MTFEALAATKVGWAINTLRKSVTSEQVRELAAELYMCRKSLSLTSTCDARGG
jgi:hypothetical protein